MSTSAKPAKNYNNFGISSLAENHPNRYLYLAVKIKENPISFVVVNALEIFIMSSPI